MQEHPLYADLTVPPQGVAQAPKSVDLALTGRCNLSCKYCFYADSMTTRTDLPTGRWLDFFCELGELGVQRVCLSGGEIFVRPDIFTLIDGVIANRMRYSILSNGTLITKDVISSFSEGKRRSGWIPSRSRSTGPVRRSMTFHARIRALTGLSAASGSLLKGNFP